MTNSEILEEMLIHIHEYGLVRDFNKKIKKFTEQNNNLEYHDKVHTIYLDYISQGLIKHIER